MTPEDFYGYQVLYKEGETYVVGRKRELSGDKLWFAPGEGAVLDG